MIVEYPEYYCRFSCIADKCPDTCCQGWEIDIDETTWNKYKAVEGELGEKLKKYMKEENGCRFFKMREDGYCAFLREDNLCQLQRQFGEDYLGVICSEHPRYFVECGNYEQQDISLACPEMARIFFAEKGNIAYCFEMYEDESDEEDIDIELRDRILDDRNRIIDIMENESGTFTERFRKAGLFREIDDKLLMEMSERMEPINEAWTKRLQHMKEWLGKNPECGQFSDKISDEWYTRLTCYLVFRYWIDSYFEKDEDEELDLTAEIMLVNYCLRLITIMYLANDEKVFESELERMVDTAYIFSREVEFDEDIVNMLKGL